MSAIVEKVMAEHVSRFFDCSCGHNITPPYSRSTSRVTHIDLFGRHVAEVTEAAVRAQIAADIQVHLDRLNRRTQTQWAMNPGWMAWGVRLLERAARIAAGGAA